MGRNRNKRKRERKNKKLWRKMYQNRLDFNDGLSEDKSIYFRKGDFKQAFSVGGLSVWGGPEADIGTREFDVVISCRERSELSMVEIFSKASQKMVKLISIPWDNNDSASLSRESWEGIIKQFPVQGEVGVCCFGGRGRTGTALSILRALMTGDKCDPIQVIRTSYNKTAVESNVQVLYVETITGLDSVCEGSYNYPLYYPFDEYYGGYSNITSCDVGTEDAIDSKKENKWIAATRARTF